MTDQALVYFLDLLVYLRCVLVQDAVALMFKDQENPPSFLKYAPFTSDVFQQFAVHGHRAIAEAEEASRNKWDQLPDKMAESFIGTVETLMIRQKTDFQRLESTNTVMMERLDLLTEANKSPLQRGAGSKKT